MGRLYTIDEKLLVDTPEIRIGDKVYAVDDRQKTVKKLMKAQDDSAESMDEALKIALGAKAFKEIDEMNLPFPAYQRLFATLIAAVTGEEPDVISARFQESKKE